MSIKNIVILALVLFFIMISCIPIDKTIGDQFVSGDYILKVDTASFDLKVTTKMPDSIQSASSYMTIGYLADPKFGVTTSAAVAQVLPSSETSDFGTNRKLKSVLLRLVVQSRTNYSEEDEGIAQNISVYQLNRAIKLEPLVGTDTIFGYTVNPTEAFNTTFTLDDCDPTPIHLGAPVYYGGDTIGITLSNAFGEQLLATTPEEFKEGQFKEDGENKGWVGFTERIKGLYITTDHPEEIKEGGRLNYLPVGASTITLNFQMTYTDPEKGLVEDRDTSEYFYVAPYFAINTVTSGSEAYVSDKLEKTIHIDAYAGVKPYINGTELKEQLDTWLKDKGYSNKSIILSRALLNFPFEMPKEDYTLVTKRYPKAIYPCIIDSDKYFQPLKDIYYSSNFNELKQNINRSLMTYACDVTSHIQGLIKKDISEVDSSDDLWVSSVVAQTDEYSKSTQYLFDNQSYYNATFNGPLAERKPTLSLVFTILAD